MHFSLLSLVSCVIAAAFAAGAWWYGRQAARRRDRHRDRVWAAEKDRAWRDR